MDVSSYVATFIVACLILLIIFWIFPFVLVSILRPRLLLTHFSTNHRRHHLRQFYISDIWTDMPEYLEKYKKIPVFFSSKHNSGVASAVFFRFIVLGRELGSIDLILTHKNISSIFSREDYMKFILFHELGHIIKRHGFCNPLYSRNLKHELEADTLGTIFLGKTRAIKSLEKIRDLALQKIVPNVYCLANFFYHPVIKELDSRIMAIDMPTLFGRYSN